MSDFKPFANDSQVLTFPSGTDELNLENGRDAVVLSGTLTISRNDPAARDNAVALLDAFAAVVNALPGG